MNRSPYPRIAFIAFFFFASLVSLSASKIVVSTDIGFDPSNSTPFLQWAFENSTEDTIIIDYTGAPWKTSPLEVRRNDITIVLEQGVLIEALPNVYDIYDPMIRIRDKANINIIGYGAELRMPKQEYINLNDSEWRHGLSLQSSINIHVEGLLIADTGGDGIFIGNSFSPLSTQNYCENVTVLNCTSTNNYRQGLSIISAKNIAIINCEFSHTNGTLPEDGIDIEPDEPEHIIQNVLIKGCRIFNNNGRAIQFAMTNLEDSSEDISVRVEDTYMSNNYDPTNAYAYTEIMATDNFENGVDGQVSFKNCLVEQSQWSAVYARKTVESYRLNFEQCVFKNVSNDPIQYNNPIFFEVTDYSNNVPRFGGATFTDCTIIYDANIPFLSVFENSATSAGLGDITGNFFIINPSNTGYESGNNPNNVNITYEYFSTPPPSTFNISTNQLDYLEEDGFITYDINRTGNLNIPMPISLDYQGSSTYGMDYSQAPGFRIFHSDNSVLSDTVSIIRDDIQEGIESLDINLVDDDCVTIGNSPSIVLSISDAVPLPVELLSFTGYKKNHSVQLIWETLNEENNWGFEVEKSRNGVDWSAITFVNAGRDFGKSSYHYEHVDKQVDQGDNYYRLKQIDLDGSFDYSKIIVINFDLEKQELYIYPNPASNLLQIETSSPEYSLEIYDFRGQLVQSIPNLSFSTSLEVHQLPQGVYLIELVNPSNGQRLQEKLIKQ